MDFYSIAEATESLQSLSNNSWVRRDLQDPAKVVCEYVFGGASSELLDATAALICIDQTVDVSRLLHL